MQIVFLYSHFYFLDHANTLLKSGRGLAIDCSENSGFLGPYEKKMISVTCYSDMWGDYNDVLICKVIKKKIYQSSSSKLFCSFTLNICRGVFRTLSNIEDGGFSKNS